MDKTARKAAAAACKELRPQTGIYALTCRQTGACWVGEAASLAAKRNQIDFALAQGGFLNRDLHAAVCRYGAAAFVFEILETLKEPEDGVDTYTRRKWMIERGRTWREKLDAQGV